MKTRLRLIAAMVVLLAGAAFAKEPSKADRAALLQTVAAFDQAMTDSDFETVIALGSDKIFASLADKAGTTRDKLVTQVVTQMKQVMKQAEIVDFSMDAEGFEIEETENGIAYAFLPTRSVFQVDDTKVETKSFTLALRDGAEWSLVRVDNAAQLKILRDVYPGFANVEFGKGTTKIIE